MKRIPKWLKTIILLVLVYLMFFLPLPYYLEVPGSVFSLDEMVEVNDERTDDLGDFYITTIGVRQATPANLITSLLPYRDLLDEKELIGNYDNFEAYNKVQKYNMKNSVNHAIKVAFDTADREYHLEYKGIYVLQVIEESSFFGKLQIGDVVRSVDGNNFSSSKEFITYIGEKTIRDKISLEVERDGETMELSGELVKLDSGVAGIGIGLVDDTAIVTEPTVVIHSADIGGPSAGLMFSLEIYTKLIEDDLRGDYDIAGTGTIEADGSVGRIGGIEKKIVAADKAGIDYFFAPDDKITAEVRKSRPDILSNYEAAIVTAQQIDSKMEIIPVQKMKDAIEFLEGLEKETSVEKTIDNNKSIFNRNFELEKRLAIIK